MQVYARPHARSLSGNSPGTSLFGDLSWNQLLVYGALKIVVLIRAREQGGWIVVFAIERHYFAQHSKDNTSSSQRAAVYLAAICSTALHCTALHSTSQMLMAYW